MFGLNLEAITRDVLQFSTPEQAVTLLIYKGQTNTRGKTRSNYQSVDAKAMIQSVSNEELQSLDAMMVKRNLLTMYIEYDVNTLSRALSTGGDFIMFNSIKYEIIKIVDQYNTGWVSCLCAETSEGGDE